MSHRPEAEQDVVYSWPFGNRLILSKKIQVLIPSSQKGILRVTLRRRQGVNVQMQDWKCVVLLSHAAEWVSPRGPFMPNLHRKTEK